MNQYMTFKWPTHVCRFLDYLPALARFQDCHFPHKWLLNYQVDRRDILQYPAQCLARIRSLVNVLNLTRKRERKKKRMMMMMTNACACLQNCKFFESLALSNTYTHTSRRRLLKFVRSLFSTLSLWCIINISNTFLLLDKLWKDAETCSSMHRIVWIKLQFLSLSLSLSIHSNAEFASFINICVTQGFFLWNICVGGTLEITQFSTHKRQLSSHIAGDFDQCIFEGKFGGAHIFQAFF